MLKGLFCLFLKWYTKIGHGGGNFWTYGVYCTDSTKLIIGQKFSLTGQEVCREVHKRTEIGHWPPHLRRRNQPV